MARRAASDPRSRSVAAMVARPELTLHAPGLLGPWPVALAREITHGIEVSGLTRILARARRVRSAPTEAECDAYERLAFIVFGFAPEGTDVPAAVVAWESDTASAAGGSVAGESPRLGGAPRLRADPVHIRADLQAARLFDSASFDLSSAEAGVMIAALNRHFEADGLRFAAPHPTRWYAWTKAAPAASFHPPCAVAGQDAGDRLPSGHEGGAWRRRMTEAQMVLHALDVNEEREAKGELPVNSIWFWGAGEAPQSPEPRFDEVWTDDPLVRALAVRSGVARCRSQDEAPGVSGERWPDGRILIAPGAALYRAVVSRDVEAWRRALLALEGRWLAPLADRLSRHHVRRLRVEAGLGPGQVIYEAGGWRSRWTFGGVRPLAEFVAC